MKKFRAENLSRGGETFIMANSAHEAHTIAQCMWSGEVVEVTTEREYDDRMVFIRTNNQLQYNLDGIDQLLPDSDYPQVLRLLRAARANLDELEHYFTCRQRTMTP